MGDNNDFGFALDAMVNGNAVRREGWNGKGMYCFVQSPDKHSKMTHPYIVMFIPECEEGERMLPWQPAQVDLFATDWEVM